MTEDPDIERARIKDFYDREYYTDHRDHDALPWHYRLIAERLGNVQGQNVLDIACGTGKWLELMSSRGAQIHGIDISELAVHACERRLPKCDVRLGVAEDLPFADATFDLVTCLGSLEHFLEPERALREMLRVAKRDARFLLLVPNSGFLPRKLGWYGGTHQVKVREVVRSLAEWDALFTSCGMSVVSRWRDLHVLSLEWIARDGWRKWPVRLIQAIVLPLWPMTWQYQVHHYCRRTAR
ncbi:MAG: methyltransferase domain-containing protein [Xanthomonadales bacterium]|nr:methyltransferase domain-containing protein [Xanthomonadales bacterium]